jgi:hypothetical protein
VTQEIRRSDFDGNEDRQVPQTPTEHRMCVDVAERERKALGYQSSAKHTDDSQLFTGCYEKVWESYFLPARGKAVLRRLPSLV